ncbi:hypothetical protein HZA33_01140 [Candidatus Pacearchaeota archaeon]|nr:hypothetical protein [Candidatus Pacearchaeota archaeon]
MVNVGIMGHTGRLGKPLFDILNTHPAANIVYTESRKEGIKGILSDADLFFLALPEGESEKYLEKIKDKRIIDLSVDHRCAEDWVYGLPELVDKKEILNAQYISSPGCYATSIILGLAPLKGKIKNICVTSSSGISGAGLQVQEIDNFLVYKEGRQHKHVQEIEKFLNEKILFVPQRIDVADKGIVSVMFADYIDNDDLLKEYNEFYNQKTFIRIKENIETRNVNGTNFCDIKFLKEDNKIIVVSALDNILKGGSGQAVQNMNLMYGLNESIGLL